MPCPIGGVQGRPHPLRRPIFASPGEAVIAALAPPLHQELRQRVDVIVMRAGGESRELVKNIGRCAPTSRRPNSPLALAGEAPPASGTEEAFLTAANGPQVSSHRANAVIAVTHTRWRRNGRLGPVRTWAPARSWCTHEVPLRLLQ